MSVCMHIYVPFCIIRLGRACTCIIEGNEMKDNMFSCSIEKLL